MRISQNLKYILLLLSTTLLGYFQLAFFVFPTKWDNLSAFFTYKYTAGWWWINGHIPLWDPYQNLGYPMHANPQGYVWYPITWLLNLPNGYSLYSLNIEVVFHLFLGAVGVFFLSQQFKVDKKWSFTSGVAYSFSGFALGTSHMIGFTIAYCWLPWVLLFTWLWLKDQSIRNTILLALTVYLHLTGAYIALSIVLFYILLIIIIGKLIKSRDLLYGKRILRSGSILGLVVLILSSPFLYSIYDSIGYISRFNPLEYDTGLYKGNFSWQCFQSLVFPYINSSVTGFQNVDVSLSNIYVGVLILIFSVIGFRLLKSKHKLLVAGTITISFLLALGIYTPIHRFTVSYIPGFDFFRHPYLFTLYPTLIMVLLSGYGLSKLNWDKLLIRNALIGVLAVILTIITYSVFNANFSEWSSYMYLTKLLADRSPLNNEAHVVIQGLFLLVILIIAVVLVSNKARFRIALPYLIVFEMFIAVQLNGPKNMYYNEPFSDVLQELDKFPYSLTNQDAQTPIHSYNNDSLRASVGLWHNLNSLERVVGSEGYNPFVFESFQQLKEGYKLDTIISKGLVQVRLNDTVSNLQLSFNKIEFEVKAPLQSTLLVLQNYHHNWSINDPHTLVRDSTGLISINVDEGQNRVTLEYSSKTTMLLHYLSLMAQGISLIILILKFTP